MVLVFSREQSLPDRDPTRKPLPHRVRFHTPLYLLRNGAAQMGSFKNISPIIFWVSLLGTAPLLQIIFKMAYDLNPLGMSENLL